MAYWMAFLLFVSLTCCTLRPLANWSIAESRARVWWYLVFCWFGVTGAVIFWPAKAGRENVPADQELWVAIIMLASLGYWIYEMLRWLNKTRS